MHTCAHGCHASILESVIGGDNGRDWRQKNRKIILHTSLRSVEVVIMILLECWCHHPFLLYGDFSLKFILRLLNQNLIIDFRRLFVCLRGLFILRFKYIQHCIGRRLLLESKRLSQKTWRWSWGVIRQLIWRWWFLNYNGCFNVDLSEYEISLACRREWRRLIFLNLDRSNRGK